MLELADHEGLTYNSPVWIWDVAWKTCRERWIIETDRAIKSVESMLAARHDNDDDE